jgi:hypothetical protein
MCGENSKNAANIPVLLYILVVEKRLPRYNGDTKENLIWKSYIQKDLFRKSRFFMQSQWITLRDRRCAGNSGIIWESPNVEPAWHGSLALNAARDLLRQTVSDFGRTENSAFAVFDPMSAKDEVDFLSEIHRYLDEERRKKDPDYSKIVYCDKHPGVKMRLADTWGSVEDGNFSVDANTIDLWVCPRPDCDRHYEPTLFGYHINERGRRLDDASKQPRGNHAERPFMYIGKEGEGRRYKCPFYKCDELGPVVADSVEDEEVRLLPDPLAKLKGAERKRALEMLVFLSFAPASGLSIDEGSPENREPDYPDILCTISGQKYWFELGRIINKEVADKLNPDRRKHADGFSYDQEKPFVELISKKATRNYEAESAPVDLILHFDRRFGTAATVEQLCKKHKLHLESLISTGPFKRVWVFDEFEKAVLCNPAS